MITLLSHFRFLFSLNFYYTIFFFLNFICVHALWPMCRGQATTLWSWFSQGFSLVYPVPQGPSPDEPCSWLVTWVLELAYRAVGFIMSLVCTLFFLVSSHPFSWLLSAFGACIPLPVSSSGSPSLIDPFLANLPLPQYV